MRKLVGSIVGLGALLVVGWAFAPSQQVTTEVHIDASPEQVWAVLSDFENYGSWNPFLPSIRGSMQVGESLTIQFASQAFGDMEITPIVLAVEDNREFRWKGKLLFPGIFDGEQKFSGWRQSRAEPGWSMERISPVCCSGFLTST